MEYVIRMHTLMPLVMYYGRCSTTQRETEMHRDAGHAHHGSLMLLSRPTTSRPRDLGTSIPSRDVVETNS